ncbi:hypothetical protein B1218_37400 [Pseudomonas ogarae]|nr:hypothetical protein B1218_37400 [Pseudomonas ogarae]
MVHSIRGGRLAAHEIMLRTSAIRPHMRDAQVGPLYWAIQTGGSLGLQTLDMCLKDLVSTLLIRREQARGRERTRDNIERGGACGGRIAGRRARTGLAANGNAVWGRACSR